MFQLVEKCYENPHFPKSSIEVIDNLYKSLPSEYFGSKYFIKLLKEANQAIWPDSGRFLYTHMEHIYEQLQQFKTSMKVRIINYLLYIIQVKVVYIYNIHIC